MSQQTNAYETVGIHLPNNNRFLRAGDEAKAHLRIPDEIYLARLRGLVLVVLAGVLVRRGLVQVAATKETKVMQAAGKDVHNGSPETQAQCNS